MKHCQFPNLSFAFPMSSIRCEAERGPIIQTPHALSLHTAQGKTRPALLLQQQQGRLCSRKKNRHYQPPRIHEPVQGARVFLSMLRLCEPSRCTHTYPVFRHLLGDLDTSRGPQSLLEITVDCELTGSQSSNHEQTSTNTSV